MGVPIALILAAAQAGYGAYKSSQAKKEAGKLAAARPVFKDSPYTQQNISLAESEMNRGSAGADAFNRNIDRSVSSSIDNLLKGGGSVNNIAEIFDASQEGRQRAMMMQDNLRQQRINSVIAARQSAEQRSQQQFQFNEWAPWADKSQANAAARTGAAEMTWSGIDSAGAAGENYFNAPAPETPTFVNAVPGSGGQYSHQFQSVTPNYQRAYNTPGSNINYINPNAAPALQTNYPSAFDDLEYDS